MVIPRGFLALPRFYTHSVGHADHTQRKPTKPSGTCCSAYESSLYGQQDTPVVDSRNLRVVFQFAEPATPPASPNPSDYSKNPILSCNQESFQRLQCPSCPNSFSTAYNLRSHITNIHHCHQPYQCLKCPAKFNKAYNLKRHLLVHSGEKPFQCAICGSQFTQRGHWRIHVLSVHSRNDGGREAGGGREFQCGFCGDVFQSRGGLEFHALIHA
ncbi:hypothetical protein BDR26DRAFT_869579 [Obelidium mucronatum]|nr:hypothetical protein BDR26DRAFT_869579 [Obelidium mucronatum]